MDPVGFDLPLERVTMEYRLVTSFPWAQGRNLTSVCLNYSSSRSELLYGHIWIQEHLNVVKNKVFVLPNLCHLSLNLNVNCGESGIGYSNDMFILKRLFEGNMPKNLTVFVLNWNEWMNVEDVGHLLDLISLQCPKLEVLLMKSLRHGLLSSDIIKTFRRCQKLRLFLVEEKNQDEMSGDFSRFYEPYFFSLLKFDLVKDGSYDSFKTTVLPRSTGNDLICEINALFHL